MEYITETNMKKMIKAIALKGALFVAEFAFNRLYAWVDVNKDGKVTKDEIVQRATELEKKIKHLKKLLKK